MPLDMRCGSHSPEIDFGWKELYIIIIGQKRKEITIVELEKIRFSTYLPAWNRWRKWRVVNSIDYNDYPRPEQVVRYLACLHNENGLVYCTILVSKSVIAIFTNVSPNKSIL